MRISNLSIFWQYVHPIRRYACFTIFLVPICRKDEWNRNYYFEMYQVIPHWIGNFTRIPNLSTFLPIMHCRATVNLRNSSARYMTNKVLNRKLRFQITKLCISIDWKFYKESKFVKILTLWSRILIK